MTSSLAVMSSSPPEIKLIAIKLIAAAMNSF